MDEDQIRAEIQRRKAMARDLKLRETVWELFSSQFKYIDDRLHKDPELVYPEIHETLKRANNANDFLFNGTNYTLTCVEGKQERDRCGREETVTTPLTLTLKTDGKLVFEFDMQTSVTYAPDAPLFNESMREIKAFIQGPWVSEVPDLLQKMRAHLQDVWKKRNALKEAERLKQEMKKFGL